MPSKSERQTGVIMAACVLGGILAGCGPPASDPVSGLDSRPAAVNTAKVSSTASLELGVQGAGQTSGTRLRGKGNPADPSDRTSVSQPAIVKNSDELTEERNAVLSSDIPEAIAKDLGSPEAHVRYRALDYWETPQEQQPPLTPVLEAMEDEDAGVRTKAATIVERHMDVEKEEKADAF